MGVSISPFSSVGLSFTCFKIWFLLAHICNSCAFLGELTLFSFFLLIFGIFLVLISAFSDIDIAFLYYLQGIFFQYFYFQCFSDYNTTILVVYKYKQASGWIFIHLDNM